MSPQQTEQPPAEPLQAVGSGGRIGLVALATDATIESDLRLLAPDDVEIFTNRVVNRNPATVENLAAMAPDITRAAAGILPGSALNLLMYACTSGTAIIGEREVVGLLQAARPQAPPPCTTPVTAALAAFAALGVRRISVLTPYIRPVNRELVGFFEGRGVEIINIHGFGLEDDTAMTGVSRGSIIQAARQTCDPNADALFISCTALRAAAVIETLEAALDKPVVSSNQALMWHALALLEHPEPPTGFGRLFRHRPPAE